MKKLLYIALIFIFNSLVTAQTYYNWPCTPFDQPHFINGTFCENRPSGSISIHHFHDGVDIHLPQGSNVYSVINGSITSLGYASTYGINAYVRVGRYAYVHVDPNPAVQVGTPVTALQTVVGATNSWNHIHFKDGYVGSEIDGLRANGGLSPFTDNYNPYIDFVKYYINGTTTYFSNNRVNGLVDIVAKARDKTDNGSLGNNNGIHAIGYQIYDSTGTVALTDSIINLEFNVIPPSDSYVTNVFFKGSDISNYYYIITNPVTKDGYINTRDLGTGTYKIKVFTFDSKLNSTSVWSTMEIVPQDVSPPAEPEMISVIGTPNYDWIVNWAQNDSLDTDGYDFYFSYDGEEWYRQAKISSLLYAQDTTYTWNNFVPDVAVYFKVQAYDNAPVVNFGEFSDAYGMRIAATGGADVLIVDGFDRTDGYWQNVNHQFATVYGNIISEFNFSFDCVSDNAIQSDRHSLNDYPNVIYFLGDESSDHKSLSLDEQTAIKNYLAQGGNLIISGSEIGFDLMVYGTEQDSIFYTDYLKSTLSGDSSSSLIIEGIEGTPFSGLSAEISPPAGKSIRPDVIEAAGSTPILKFANGQTAAIHYNGTFGDSGTPANLVYLTFPLELINDDNVRQALLRQIFELFGQSTDIAFESPAAPVNEFILFDNYPNPFNPSTKISFKLPTSEWVNLSIYTIQGRLVKNLVQKNLTKGSYEFTWNGTDNAGNNVSSGVYLYRLETSSFSDAKKMILIR
jgi:hypothetical protein